MSQEMSIYYYKVPPPCHLDDNKIYVPYMYANVLTYSICNVANYAGDKTFENECISKQFTYFLWNAASLKNISGPILLSSTP